MPQWRSDAHEALEEYLQQVAVLAQAQGMDADALVGPLRTEIEQEAENAAEVLVRAEHLRDVLATMGTPEQVVRAQMPPPQPPPVPPPDPAPASGPRPPTEPPPFDPSKVPLPPPPPRPPPMARQPAPSGAGPWIACAVIIPVAFVFLVGVMAAILLPALARSREAARRASCQNNLKQLGLVLRMSANESRGELFPELSPEAGRLMFANESACSDGPLWPEYLTDLSPLICPSHADADDLRLQLDQGASERFLDDDCYFYLGYALTSDAEVQAFARAYRERIAQGLRFDTDLEVGEGNGNGGGSVIYRLREGVGRVLAADPQNPMDVAQIESRIPVIMDRGFLNHIPAGCNVLFMDGHVEFILFPRKWPVTRETIETLETLDGL